ncbi:methyltransferase domain-containing protein [Parasphingorhabdus halotolerans]|uniref:methyltransferase domain-containing protein n=1 Tax=Parasphingorhabdus halotolerans TaxID=2725558 RepID=UPI001FE7D3B6|nr:methyltransferase domain-containing protein [Parasphingorhabdus halotolerans]
MRDRAFSAARGEDFLSAMMADELLERLSLVKRDFSNCLLIGGASKTLRKQLEAKSIACVATDASFRTAQSIGDVQCDEDRLPFADHSFDLIINIGTLDTVNDLPGALVLSRRILKPDGLFLAAFIGAESLTALKAILMESEGDRIAPHVHPQIDIRTMGDLMSRSGLQLPVVDSDSLELRYGSIEKLIEDIRNFGGSNVLKQQTHNIQRTTYLRAKQGFDDRLEADGKVTEKIEIIYLCGWAPHPDQPKPATRGSGKMSLKAALNQK